MTWSLWTSDELELEMSGEGPTHGPRKEHTMKPRTLAILTLAGLVAATAWAQTPVGTQERAYTSPIWYSP